MSALRSMLSRQQDHIRTTAATGSLVLTGFAVDKMSRELPALWAVVASLLLFGVTMAVIYFLLMGRFGETQHQTQDETPTGERHAR
jgi:hypothetical protein